MSTATTNERWAVIRRAGVGEYVATLRLPPFKAGDKVKVDLTWQGNAPAADDIAAERGLARNLREMAEQLGVRIRLPLQRQPEEHGAPAPGLATGVPATVQVPQACPVSSPLVTT